ncbi:conserved hypothetical protein [uncultured Alphaproteobacteria bacterium]|uniref:GTPase domain-containing protein n=1 Tax=uncultured Alphaproteobacteria bacterium TaxID=91750 RepID=A0A212J0X9_9PROT|nr:conserved hypothetical protein [uncultured Alphaproteobacteria bacterium]
MTDTIPDNEADGVEGQTPGEAETCATARACPDEAAIAAIIRKRVYAAIGVGFVPLPLVDFLGLSAVQLDLIHELAKAYGVEFRKERVKSIVSSLCGGALTTASVPFAASLLKSIPVIGLTTGVATISIMGGATTYALGCVFDRHFRKGGSLVDFDAEEAKTYFKTKVEEGKDFVGKIRKKVKKDKSAAADEPAMTEQAAPTA